MKEWLNLDWTPETISSYGIIFFIAFGSVALGIQGWKIWKNKSGASVSVPWTFIFFSMFAAYPILGVERHNSLMIWQGALRIAFYVPILYGLYKFEGFTRKERGLARMLFLTVFLMIEYPSAGEFIYGIINILGVFGVFAQGRLIQKEKKTGVVSAVLLFAYATNASLWVWYMYEVKYLLLFLNAALFVPAYVYTIAIWAKFRFLELSHTRA